MEEIKVIFKYANFGNIACLHVIGTKIQNDINNYDAIILYNALLGRKNDNALEKIKDLQSKLDNIVKYLENKIKEPMSLGKFTCCQNLYVDLLNKIKEDGNATNN